MLELSPEDLYQLRKMQMDTEKRTLELQKSQQDLDRFLWDLEHKHGLILEGKTIDAKTATIREAAPNPHNNGNGKGPTKELISATLEKAGSCGPD